MCIAHNYIINVRFVGDCLISEMSCPIQYSIQLKWRTHQTKATVNFFYHFLPAKLSWKIHTNIWMLYSTTGHTIVKLIYFRISQSKCNNWLTYFVLPNTARSLTQNVSGGKNKMQSIFNNLHTTIVKFWVYTPYAWLGDWIGWHVDCWKCLAILEINAKWHDWHVYFWAHLLWFHFPISHE